jgi:hypothetical protein
MILEFVYFFKSSIVIYPIEWAKRTNSIIYDSSIGPLILLFSHLKVIPIHIINIVWVDPKGETSGNLPHLRIHQQIGLALQAQGG